MLHGLDLDDYGSLDQEIESHLDRLEQTWSQVAMDLDRCTDDRMRYQQTSFFRVLRALRAFVVNHHPQPNPPAGSPATTMSDPGA